MLWCVHTNFAFDFTWVVFLRMHGVLLSSFLNSKVGTFGVDSVAVGVWDTEGFVVEYVKIGLWNGEVVCSWDIDSEPVTLYSKHLNKFVNKSFEIEGKEDFLNFGNRERLELYPIWWKEEIIVEMAIYSRWIASFEEERPITLQKFAFDIEVRGACTSKFITSRALL